jgi:hypothetical protein
MRRIVPRLAIPFIAREMALWQPIARTLNKTGN